jgi:putative ABC transport system ATP-binding protein
LPDVLEFRDLKKRIGDAKQPGEQRLLFERVSAAVGPSDRIALLGVSGQGKSTLLRILARLDVPDEGEILLDGTPSDRVDPRLWRMDVCYVAQHSVMLPGTIEENLRTVSRLHDIPFDRKLAERLIGELGLDGVDLRKQAAELSGGEKQRFALIRALLLRSKVLLLDEITASLDRGSKERVEKTLLKWNAQEGTTQIWITHDLEQARLVSRRTWFMARNTLLEDTPTETFFRAPEAAEARDFLRIGTDEVQI